MNSEQNGGDFPKSKSLPSVDKAEEKASTNPEADENWNRHSAAVCKEGKKISATCQAYYDPQLLRPKSIICSEIIAKSRLTTRDANIQNSTEKSSADSDEAFFEALKNRIIKDREKNGTNKIDTNLPKRSSAVRKRRSLFNNESLNLIKKFRIEVAARTDRLSVDHGIFTMSRRNSQNPQDQDLISTKNVANERNQVNVENRENSPGVLDKTPINDMTSGSEQELLYPSPMLVINDLNENNFDPTTSSTVSKIVESWNDAKKH